MADHLAKAARINHSVSLDLSVVTYDQGGIYLSFKGVDSAFPSGHRLETSAAEGKIMKDFRTSFQKTQKLVRAHAITSGNEKIWSYFILATLRWLTPPPISQGEYPICWFVKWMFRIRCSIFEMSGSC